LPSFIHRSVSLASAPSKPRITVFGTSLAASGAAAGTYAIGRAAIAYFIDGVTLASAKELFAKNKKTKPPQLTAG
jgi:uncharacterized protein (DUF697 family)